MDVKTRLALGAVSLLAGGAAAGAVVAAVKPKRTRRQRRAAVAAATHRMLKRDYGYEFDRSRNILGSIKDAAQQGTKLRIRYVPAYNNQESTHIVEPYSFRVKRGKNYFYAYDTRGKTIGIHSFIPSRITAASPTKVAYEPRWPVEISERKKYLY